MFDREIRLVRRLRERDRDAAVELVDRYYRRVYHYLVSLGRDPDLAADLVQETFCSVWGGIDSFRSRSSLSTWIHSIARNHFLQHLRRRGPGESPSETDLGQLPDRRTAAPDAGLALDDRDRGLRERIDGLPPDRREVVQLHYLQELTLRETSGVLGIPVGTVKSRLHAALRDLRRGFRKGETRYANQES